MQSKFTTAKLFTMFRNIRHRSSSHLAFDGVVDTKGSSARPHHAEEPHLSPALSIPSPDPTGEERACDMYQTAGQRLARQEDWPGVSRAIRDAEAAATRTPGGMPVADLIAFGARADVVHAAEHALLSGRPAKDAPLLDGIIALEEVLAEFPDDYVIATVVARRMASRSQAIWGAGGYTWVMLDAIALDDAACSQLDIAFFIEGLHDILTRRTDQHTVNLLAAYCANTMGMTLDAADEVAFVRGQIADCAKWIIRQHLTELHPMIWAHAARGFDNNLRVRCPDRFAAAGAADAHRILCDMFRRELSQGKRVVFTDRGAQLEPV